MASSSSTFPVTSSSLSSNKTAAFFSVPPLQELAAVYIINQYDSIAAITADLHSYFDMPVLKKMLAMLKTQLNILLGHVVAGELKQAEETIINANPKLLLALFSYKGTVVDAAGRTIYGTAWQIALGAKDVSIGEHEEMVEMIARYVKQLPDGEEELKRQYAEQFPAGYKEREEERRRNDLAALKKVFAAIGESNIDEECETAIKAFHDYLKNKPKG